MTSAQVQHNQKTMHSRSVQARSFSEDDIKKAITSKDQEIEEYKWKILERYREITPSTEPRRDEPQGPETDEPQRPETDEPQGPETDEPQGPETCHDAGTDPEDDPIIKMLRRRIEELEEEVNTLKGEAKTLQEEVGTLKTKVEDLEDDRCVVIIGELCKRLQENIYRFVLPEKIAINPRLSYKVKHLEKFITKRKKMIPEEKKHAKKRWTEMKTALNWDDGEEDWEDLIGKLQKLRNRKCHLKLTEEIKQEVVDAIEELNKESLFDDLNSSQEEVKKLLEMYEKTNEMLK